MPQFEVPNIDEALSHKMGDLSSMIGGRQYQQVGSPESLPEGVNLSGQGDPNAPQDIAQYAGNVANAGMPGLTPQSYPVAGAIDPAEVQRLQQVAYDASMRQIEAEEAAFQASIAHLPEEERLLRAMDRELQQTRQVNEWLTNKNEQQVQAQTMQQLRQNKNEWIILIAHESGLPRENQGVVAALERARNPQEMYAIANNLKQLMGGTNQASRNAMNNGILSPGSRIGSAPQQGPKQRSGDIGGLIGSRGYVTVTG